MFSELSRATALACRAGLQPQVVQTQAVLPWRPAVLKVWPREHRLGDTGGMITNPGLEPNLTLTESEAPQVRTRHLRNNKLSR